MMKPMPMRPRLPMGGIQLAASSSISTELAETPCPSSCRRNSTCSDGNIGVETPTFNCSSSNVDAALRKPPAVKSSSFGEHHQHSHHNHSLVMERQSSFSNLDLFKMDDIAEDMFIPSSEPMNFDDSIMTLVTDEGNNNNSNHNHVHHHDHSGQRQQEQLQHYHHHHQSNQSQQIYGSNDNNEMDAYVLHRTVLLFPNDANLVHTALVGSSKQAALTPSPLPHSGYYYPLHLAICQGANLPVLQLLVQAGPQVLMQKDGHQGFTPLMLALNHLPHRPDVHELLRKACPQAAGIPCDANQELPLHVACRLSASSKNGCLGFIQGLLQDHPAAVVHASGRGFTPLNLVAMQPAASPHRAMLYQSLQFVAQNLPRQHPSHGMGSMGPGPLTAPC